MEFCPLVMLVFCILLPLTSQSGWNSDLQTEESRDFISEINVKNIQDILLLPPEEPEVSRRHQRIPQNHVYKTQYLPPHEYMSQEHGSLSSYAEQQGYIPNHEFRPHQFVNEMPPQEHRPYHTQKYLPNHAYKIYEVSDTPEDNHQNAIQYQKVGHRYGFQQPSASKTNKKVDTTSYIVQQAQQNLPTESNNHQTRSEENINRAAGSGTNTKQNIIITQPQQAVQHAVGIRQPGSLVQTLPVIPPQNVEETLRVLAHLQALKAAQSLPINPVSALLLASSLRRQPYLPGLII